MITEKTELICIGCPRGCCLQVSPDGDQIAVTGNDCKRGIDYAQQELTNPVRVLTALMRVSGCSRPLSVKTDGPVPKDMLRQCAKEIYRTHPDAPVSCGDILIANVCGTGANVIATCDSSECE